MRRTEDYQNNDSLRSLFFIWLFSAAKSVGLNDFFGLEVQRVAGHEVAGGAFDLSLWRHMGAITVNMSEDANFDCVFVDQIGESIGTGLQVLLQADRWKMQHQQQSFTSSLAGGFQ